jgi:hypothetical protein
LIVVNFWFLGASLAHVPCFIVIHQFFCREERHARELHEESLRTQMAHEEAAQLRSLKETGWIYSSVEKMLWDECLVKQY